MSRFNIFIFSLLGDDIVGKKFSSEEEAWDFFAKKAKAAGFGIRKEGTKRRKDGSLCAKKFVCNKEGKKNKKKAERRCFSKGEKCTGCRALVVFYIDKGNTW